MQGTISRGVDRWALAPAAILSGGVAALSVSVVTGRGIGVAAFATLTIATFVTVGRHLSSWHVLLGVVVCVIMFIPIKRGEINAGLPFDIEPYRIVVALVLLLWLGSLLADPRVRLRGSVVDAPLALFLLAVVGSILTNTARVSDVLDNVTKKCAFLLSFFLVYLFITSVVRDVRAIHAVLKTFVAGAGVVAFFAVVEARTGFNAFDFLAEHIPLMNFEGGIGKAGLERSGRLRVYASAQHPIALAAVLVMALPLSIYLARQARRKRWWAVTGMVTLGALSTISRTGVVMLIVIALIFLWLRPKELRRLWPLIVPGLLVVHLALPATIGGLTEAFFPRGGIVKDQTAFGGRASARRLQPNIEIIRQQPLFGQGYGTRIPSGPRQNVSVLDDEWLGTGVETGLVGLFAWVWFFWRFVKRLGSEAKRDLSSRGWLLAALASAVAAFAIAMFTFDAFSFIQVTFVLFILAALGMNALTQDPWEPERRRPRRSASRLTSAL